MFWVLLTAVSIIMPTVPGAIDPSVTQQNIATTICKAGYTGTVRPPVAYTNRLKSQEMKALGLTGMSKSYEEDHLISLEIGGSPTDPNNLWPEYRKGEWNAWDKDRLENHLHKLVCAGTITLDEAQHEISTNWVDAYKKYFGDKYAK